MERIKEIEDAAKVVYPGSSGKAARQAFLYGARWADNHPRGRLTWHSVAEEPEKLVNILADNGDGSGFVVMWANQEVSWQQLVLFSGMHRWAYMIDIMGEE